MRILVCLYHIHPLFTELYLVEISPTPLSPINAHAVLCYFNANETEGKTIA